jgi:hypothetical protein
VSSSAKHRADPPPRPAGTRFTPMLFAVGGLIALTGMVAGGAGILGVLRL